MLTHAKFSNVHHLTESGSPEVRHEGHPVTVLDIFAPDPDDPCCRMAHCICVKDGEPFAAFIEELIPDAPTP